MTLAGTRRDFLGFIWQGFSMAGRIFRSAHLRVIARRQARLLAQQPITPQPMPQQTIITVAAQPIAPQPIITEPAPLSPTEAETLQVSEQVSCQMVRQPELSYETQDTQDDKTGQLELTRGQLVEALLDEAWGRGQKTYPKLIAYVTEQTGTGCSRRAVAAWKKNRGLA